MPPRTRSTTRGRTDFGLRTICRNRGASGRSAQSRLNRVREEVKHIKRCLEEIDGVYGNFRRTNVTLERNGRDRRIDVTCLCSRTHQIYIRTNGDWFNEPIGDGRIITYKRGRTARIDLSCNCEKSYRFFKYQDEWYCSLEG